MPMAWSNMGMGGEDAAAAAMQWISQSGVDENVAEIFMKEPAQVQDAVMARGSLESASDKNSACMARIGKAKRALKEGMGGMEGMAMMKQMMGMMMSQMMSQKGGGKGGGK